jgi:uncharacterized membrane protein SpoIIM required for sporulation
MTANAILFFFGAVQHVGITLGPFHEPHIIPAAIVEGTCGLALASGAVASFHAGWRTAVVANLIAVAGVLLGMAALAAGRGPRTASNDFYHRVMLVLAGASVVILFLQASSVTLRNFRRQ